METVRWETSVGFHTELDTQFHTRASRVKTLTWVASSGSQFSARNFLDCSGYHSTATALTTETMARVTSVPHHCMSFDASIQPASLAYLCLAFALLL